MNTYTLLAASVAVVAVGVWLWMPVGGDYATAPHTGDGTSTAPEPPPGVPVDVAFLHHSVGTQLLAPPDGAPATEERPTHPNGGGLAGLLAASNYRLHEATYGSALGERTDLFDWLPKFRAHMDDILAIQHQDQRLPEGQRNRVVVFKSCFPNNAFVGAGAGAGSAEGPALTEANARAALTAVLGQLATRPDVLFVYVTAPPVAPVTWRERRWKSLLKTAMGRPTQDQEFRESGQSARRFNAWVVSPDGWLKGYTGGNVAVFDLYGVLTEHGESGFSRYASLGGTDSHPSREGNTRVARLLVSFLNREVRRAGIAP